LVSWSRSSTHQTRLKPFPDGNFGPKRSSNNSKPPAVPQPPAHKQLNLFEANGIAFSQFNTPGYQKKVQPPLPDQPPRLDPSNHQQLNWFEYNNFGYHNIDPSLLPSQPQEQYKHWDIAEFLQTPLKPSTTNENPSRRRRAPKSNRPLDMSDLRQELPKHQLSTDGKATDPTGGRMSRAERDQRQREGTLPTGDKHSDLLAIRDYLEAHPAEQLGEDPRPNELLAKAQAFKAQQAQSRFPSSGVQVTATELTPRMFAPPESNNTVPPQPQSQSTQPKDTASPDLLAQRSFVVPHAKDVQQQVLTQKPMQSMTDLEAAAIQQRYRFKGADFTRWVVGRRQQDEALRAAYEAEFRRLGDGASPSERMAAATIIGYDGGHPGTFSSSTPLKSPHQNAEGRFFYNTTLNYEADAYYQKRLTGWAQEWRQMVEANRQWKLQEQQREAQARQLGRQQAEQELAQQAQRQAQQRVQQRVQGQPHANPAQGTHATGSSGVNLPPIAFNNQYVVPQGAQPQGAQPQGSGVVLTPEQRFEYTVANRAQGLLKSNNDRLNAEQTHYAQDTNPKSDRWKALWQAAHQTRQLEAQEQQSELQQQQVFNQRYRVLPREPGMSNEQYAQAKQAHEEKLGTRQVELDQQLRRFHKERMNLRYAFPALAAVEDKDLQNQDVRAVQQRIPQKFDGIRGDIERLSGQLTQDPKVGLMLDAVVNQQLADYSQPEQQQLRQWVNAQQKARQGDQAMLGTLAGLSGLAAIGISLTPLAPAAAPFAAQATILGGATAVMGIPDLALMHQAAQAGRGGAGQLTNKSPEQALWELALGGAAVTLAATDMGLGVKQMGQLSRTAQELSQGGVTLSRGQWSDGLKAAQQGDGAVQRFIAGLKDASATAKEKIRRALASIYNGKDPQAELVDVPSGQSAVKTTEENAKDAAKALQAKTKGGGSGKSKQPPKPQAPTTPELPEFKDIKLGKELGSGGNKIAYEVPGREDVAIAILEKGKPADAINKEIGFLNELKEQGLPTVEVLGTTTHNGQPAMIMKKYAQGSKDVVQTEKNKARIIGKSELLNGKSISELKKVRSLMESKKIKIDDLQFLINRDGSVVIADPLGYHLNTSPSKTNKDTIDLSIKSAEENLENR
jgi:hypothetical protein